MKTYMYNYLKIKYSILFFNIHEECPLGNDFLPSLIATGFPLHLKSEFTLPSGKHLQKKSGLGRPTKTFTR